MSSQSGTVPGAHAAPGRRGNSAGGKPVERPGRSVGGQAAAWMDDPRYYGAPNDSQIRRDRTPWYPTSARSGVGTGTVDWTAAGPPRPELHMRNVTVRIMAGTSRTRNLANPQDPRQGLHSAGIIKPSGNLGRIQAGRPGMKHGRTDRLSPARYRGQTYSQTTVEQGGIPR